MTQQGLHKSHRLKLKISTTHQIMAVNTTKKNFGNKDWKQCQAIVYFKDST